MTEVAEAGRGRGLPRLETLLAVTAAIPGVEQSVHRAGAGRAGDKPPEHGPPAGSMPRARADDDGRSIGPRRRCQWNEVFDEVLKVAPEVEGVLHR